MQTHQRDPDPELTAALRALQDNRFWQQFCRGLRDKRGYFSRRLREAEDYAAFRFICGQLELAEQLLAEIAAAAQPVRRDEDGLQ